MAGRRCQVLKCKKKAVYHDGKLHLCKIHKRPTGEELMLRNGKLIRFERDEKMLKNVKK